MFPISQKKSNNVRSGSAQKERVVAQRIRPLELLISSQITISINIKSNLSNFEILERHRKKKGAAKAHLSKLGPHKSSANFTCRNARILNI